MRVCSMTIEKEKFEQLKDILNEERIKYDIDSICFGNVYVTFWYDGDYQVKQLNKILFDYI